MKYIKISSILLVSTILMALAINYIASVKPVGRVEAQENLELSKDELKRMFPDANFRNVVTNHLKNNKITLENIQNLNGEFYAVNEDIEDITGIKYLKNIEKFIFSNNYIKTIPEEILNLENIKSINLSNNYLTENAILNELSSKNIKVDSSLNFIKNQSNQYKLNSHYEHIVLEKGEKVLIYKLLYKELYNCSYYSDSVNRMPVSLKYQVYADSNIIEVKNDFYLKALKPGYCNIKISLDDNFYNGSTVDISIEVV